MKKDSSAASFRSSALHGFLESFYIWMSMMQERLEEMQVSIILSVPNVPELSLRWRTFNVLCGQSRTPDPMSIEKREEPYIALVVMPEHYQAQ